MDRRRKVISSHNIDPSLQSILASGSAWLDISKGHLSLSNERLSRLNSHSNFIRGAHELNPWHLFEDYTINVPMTSPRGQQVE